MGLVVEVLIENIKWLYTQTSVLCHADPSQNYSEVMLVSTMKFSAEMQIWGIKQPEMNQYYSILLHITCNVILDSIQFNNTEY